MVSSTTNPDTAATMSAQEAAAAALRLPGVIGAELARPLSSLQRVIQDIKRTRTISRSQMQILDEAAQSAHRIARHSQQLSRIAGGRLRQSHERLGLHSLLEDVLQDRLEYYRASGVEVRTHIKPIEVIVDPGLLFSLLGIALDWALERGRQLRVSLDVMNWPEHAVLVIKASEQVAVPGLDDEHPNPDTLNWHLLQQIAQAMGVPLHREVEPDHSVVRIEFPRTVRQLEGLTAVEVDMGGDSRDSFAYHSAYHSESRPLAGHRLLLVTAEPALRNEVKEVCELMGLVMDSTPTIAQAIRFCELDKPHIIVLDERLRDERFDELHRDLVRHDINFPVVEIARASNTFEMSNWMSDSMSRLSRDAVGVQLPSILVMELAKVS